jgi:inward rectifier potassium channel
MRHETGRRVAILGLRRHLRRDLYHGLITSSWTSLFIVVAIAYVGINALFAAAYLALGDAIDNATPGSPVDAFFFSVQTMATIGYGRMVPRTLAANVLVTLEALTGMLTTALATGLIFAKFARPTARVLFSRLAVVGPYDRTPSFMFRMANERANQIVDAALSVMLVRNETIAEGELIRRVHDLTLRRSQSALFGLTWTAVHAITRESPLYGESAESLAEAEAEIVVSLTGVDESLAQTIHTRFVYAADRIRWDARFADLMVMRRRKSVLDFRHFHEIVPLATASPRQPPRVAGR